MSSDPSSLSPGHSQSPQVEITGGVVLAMVNVMGAFKSVALRILASHGIPDPQPERWYRHRDFLDAVRSIVLEVGPSTLYQIGRQVALQGELPPGVRDVHAILGSLDEAYHSQHRGDADIGHYLYCGTGERTGTMVCSTPNPSDFDRGLLHALVERVAPGGLVDVHLDLAAENRADGASSCTFLLAW